MEKIISKEKAAIYVKDGVLIIDCREWNTTGLHRNVKIEFTEYKRDGKLAVKVTGFKPRRTVFSEGYGNKMDLYDSMNFDQFTDDSIEVHEYEPLSWFERPVSCMWNKEERKKWKYGWKVKRIKPLRFVEYKTGGKERSYESNNYIIIH